MVVSALVDTAPGLIRRGWSPAVATPVWAAASAVIRPTWTSPPTRPAPGPTRASWAAIPVGSAPIATGTLLGAAAGPTGSALPAGTLAALKTTRLRAGLRRSGARADGQTGNTYGERNR
ncbi:hypothetical protein BH09ACT7_BH09ACT7_49370 [soil metagenome]